MIGIKLRSKALDKPDESVHQCKAISFPKSPKIKILVVFAAAWETASTAGACYASTTQNTNP